MYFYNLFALNKQKKYDLESSKMFCAQNTKLERNIAIEEQAEKCFTLNARLALKLFVLLIMRRDCMDKSSKRKKEIEIQTKSIEKFKEKKIKKFTESRRSSEIGT